MRGYGIDGDKQASVGSARLSKRSFATPVFRLALALFLALGTGAAVAEEDGHVGASDTSSPRDTIQSFITACNDFYELIDQTPGYFDRDDPEHVAIAERALDCIDDSGLPAFAREERAGEAAVCIKEILDRVKVPPWEQIPNMADITAAGGFEKLSDYRIPYTRLTISRVEQGPRRHEYLFSPGTVERSRRYFKSIESKPYRRGGPQVSKNFYRWYLSAPGHPALAAIVHKLPESMQLGRTWGMANWKWPGLLVVVLLAFTLVTMFYRWQVALTGPALQRGLLKYWLTMIFPIAAVLVFLAVDYAAYHYLTLRSTALYISDFCTGLLTLLAGLVVVFAFSNRVAGSIIASPHINPAGLNAQLIRISSKVASFVIAVVICLVGGQYLGIPIATLLASAGIGGVALALGAQDTLKTLFGTLVLLTDKPFRVGDRIIFKEFDGVVEDIGLRSTRLRLLSGPQVVFPNDQLAQNHVENVARRQYIRRTAEIHIPLDTHCEKVEQAVTIIREELQDHEGMDPDRPPRVYFNDFNANAFSIEFIYWYTCTDYWKFKAFSDKLNFEIFRKFEAQGIQFSLPFRHSFWKQDDVQGPLDVKLLSDGERHKREN